MKQMALIPMIMIGLALTSHGAHAQAVALASNGDSPRTIEVRVVDNAYEPGEFEVRKGDTVRLIQRGQAPHNLEFTRIPDGADLGDLERTSFLTRRGQVHEFVIDERFVPGKYEFVCTPHVTFGMTGTMVVVEP